MSTRAEISCIEVVEVVTDYLERELGEAEVRVIEEHLAECEGCTAYVEQMRMTVSALRALETPPVEVDMETLMATLRARTEG
jgi:predicted anti-sigma-YlaC factor YlaD